TRSRSVMFTAQRASSNHARRAAIAPRADLERRDTRHSSTRLERNASSACACGGGCPRCAAKGTTPRNAVEMSGIERKNGVVHGPAGSPNRFDDCPAQWKTAANAAQSLGSSWLTNVVNGLTLLPNPIPAPVAKLLTKHFHTTFDKDITK